LRNTIINNNDLVFKGADMSPFKINFLKLLKSTAMTLLFIPGVSAMMQDEGDGREEYKHSMAPSAPTVGVEGASSSSGGRASTSFTQDFIDRFFGEYVSSRLNVGNTEQYKGTHMPQAPVVHPYGMSDEQERERFSMPAFPYAARLSARELDPNLFPALFEAQATLRNLGIAPEDPKKVDYFIVVQDDPWNDGPWFYRNPKTQELIETKRLLRPQSWAFPEAPDEIGSVYSKVAKINVAIFSPNNEITLVSTSEEISPSEGVIHSHNGIDEKNPNGNPTVVSSGPAFPMFSGLRANKTSFFVSTVVIPDTKRAAVTFHTILDDTDFGLLQRTEIKTLSELQKWLGNLFQSKYGVTSDSSSPYSNWTTSAGSSAPVNPAPSSSSSIPAVIPTSSSSTPAVTSAVKPALELDTREFHMGKFTPFPTSGFSHHAQSHIWTEGNKATITLPLVDMASRPSRISFLNTGGFVTGSHEQELIVKVNGKEIRRYVYSVSNNNQIIDIDLPPQLDLATIEFEIPKAISPLDLGISADKRKLGISFGEVKFQY
jgi:hypothetical protein